MWTIRHTISFKGAESLPTIARPKLHRRGQHSSGSLTLHNDTGTEGLTRNGAHSARFRLRNTPSGRYFIAAVGAFHARDESRGPGSLLQDSAGAQNSGALARSRRPRRHRHRSAPPRPGWGAEWRQARRITIAHASEPGKGMIGTPFSIQGSRILGIYELGPLGSLLGRGPGPRTDVKASLEGGASLGAWGAPRACTRANRTRSQRGSSTTKRGRAWMTTRGRVLLGRVRSPRDRATGAAASSWR